MNLSKYDYTERKARETEEAAKTSRTDKPEAAPSAPAAEGPTLFGRRFSEKEQKSLFLYLIIGIVLAELAVTVGAIVISITLIFAVLSTLRYFRDEYEAHVVDKRCPAGVCKSLLKYTIDPEKCIGCTACARQCPVGAIAGEVKKAHVIDQDKCIKCGACEAKCRFKAISRG